MRLYGGSPSNRRRGEEEIMSHVLILAAEYYDVTGPMKTLICGYAGQLERDYDVTIKKMPYHLFVWQKRKVWEDLAAAIREDTIAIIPSCMNICYYLLGYKGKIRGDIQLIAWQGDCAIRGKISELRAMGRNSEYPGLRQVTKTAARLMLYYHKEKIILKKYKKVLVITREDMEYMRNHYRKISAELKLLPYSIPFPSGKLRSCQVDRQKELRIGFLGHFKADSIDSFFMKLFHDCETRILKEVPQLKIVIAGRGATKEQVALLRKYDFVEYMGEVAELSEFYESVHMIFTTIPKQAGILTKVLEAFSYEKCVVGYRSNFAPIVGVAEGVDYLGADSAREFTEVFKAVLAGEIDIDRMGQTARAHIMQNYSWERNGGLLQKYIEERE